MIIGSHVSFSKDGLYGSAMEAVSYGANTFMFYTGAPQNTIRKEINDNDTKRAIDLMNRNGIDINNVICHAPYIINLANKAKADTWNFSIEFLKNEIKRCEKLGVKYIVLHPGSAVTHTHEEGLANISEALNKVIDKNTNVMILLETMAGKGTECGNSLDDISYLVSHTIYKDKIGVCLDTCHLNDSGVDLKCFDEYLNKFEESIGLNKIKCVHINDSLNVLGSRKDRHANIGFGTIGFNTLINVIYNPKLKDVPKILETPYIEDNPPYKFEIESILNKKINENLKNDVLDYYKNL